jgi:hypothetical protein
LDTLNPGVYGYPSLRRPLLRRLAMLESSGESHAKWEAPVLVLKLTALKEIDLSLAAYA